MINCLVRGAGDGVAGGCWHTCFAYTRLPWTNPPGFHDCEGLSAKSARTERDSLCIERLPASVREQHGLAGVLIVLLLEPSPEGRGHEISTDGCTVLGLDRKQTYEIEVYADGKKIEAPGVRLGRFPDGEARVWMDPASGDWQVTPMGSVPCCALMDKLLSRDDVPEVSN